MYSEKKHLVITTETLSFFNERIISHDHNQNEKLDNNKGIIIHAQTNPTLDINSDLCETAVTT